MLALTSGTKSDLGCLGNFLGLSVAWRSASALGRPSSIKKFENAPLRLLGCARVVTIDHVGATEILLGKPAQMFAVPAMRGVSKDVPLNGRACVLRRLKLRNTFIRRRLGILVAHQYQDGTINTILNDFVWRGSLGSDREARGIYCDGRSICLASWQNRSPGAVAGEQRDHRAPGKSDMRHPALVDKRERPQVIGGVHSVAHAARNIDAILWSQTHKIDVTRSKGVDQQHDEPLANRCLRPSGHRAVWTILMAEAIALVMQDNGRKRSRSLGFQQAHSRTISRESSRHFWKCQILCLRSGTEQPLSPGRK
jgi:hypothetical protein